MLQNLLPVVFMLQTIFSFNNTKIAVKVKG